MKIRNLAWNDIGIRRRFSMLKIRHNEEDTIFGVKCLFPLNLITIIVYIISSIKPCPIESNSFIKINLMILRDSRWLWYIIRLLISCWLWYIIRLFYCRLRYIKRLLNIWVTVDVSLTVVHHQTVLLLTVVHRQTVLLLTMVHHHAVLLLNVVHHQTLLLLTVVHNQTVDLSLTVVHHQTVLLLTVVHHQTVLLLTVVHQQTVLLLTVVHH